MKTRMMTIVALLLWTGCQLYGKDAPVAHVGNVVFTGSVYEVPVTVTGFSDVGSCNLKLSYNFNNASALSVRTGSALGGTLASNLGLPGVVSIGWFTWPGKNLEDGETAFVITFSKLRNGPVAIDWMVEDNSCRWWDSNGDLLNDVPVVDHYFPGSASSPDDAPLAEIPTVTTCLNNSLTVPVNVYSFNNIGSVTLTLNYDPASVEYVDAVVGEGFPGLHVEMLSAGVIRISGSVPQGVEGITLPAGTLLTNLDFIYKGGTTGLVWSDDGGSCEYKGPPSNPVVLSDTPVTSYFINGRVSETPVPDIPGQVISLWGDRVDRGQTDVEYRVDPVKNATGYVWTLPPGASITEGENTNRIKVSFSATAQSGEIRVAGMNACHQGEFSEAFRVIVNQASGIGSPGSGEAESAGFGDIRVFPNPCLTNPVLDFQVTQPGRVTVEVIDMLGSRADKIEMDCPVAGPQRIGLGNVKLAPGIYTVRLINRTGNGIYVKSVRLVCSR